MNNAVLVALSASEVLAGFRNGSLTPDTYIAACLERISRVNPKVNALAAIDGERAVMEAGKSTARWAAGTPIGPLDGLPIGVKDLQDTKGLLTTHGSQRARGNVPANDLPMVAKLRAAGAIVLAKTNVPELGAGGNTRNPVWGATGNPFDLNLTAGGSSGGSAAALAAEMLPLCTGSDTGGSLRIPSALCGIVGFRPSVSVVAHPTRPLGWSGISVLGPMARTVDDLVLMLDVCRGADLDDPLSSPLPDGPFAATPEATLGNLRVGYSEDFGGAPVDPSIRATFRARLSAIGPHVASCDPVDLNLGEMDKTFDVLRAESFLAGFGAAIEATPEAFGPFITANVALGRSFSLADRAWAHTEQTRILRKFNAMMANYDVILLPTAPVSPFPWTQSHVTEIEGTAQDIYYRWLALSYRGSLMGGPALALPTGKDAQGMPFGLQMLGPVGGDAALIATAKALESLLATSPETARPRPDLESIAPSKVDLRSIVTHPPMLAGGTKSNLQTAV
ncbi:amidase [Rhodobacteraceae bacterium M385]|nr:amidase [Rhodobacteraceae bacterium M385]